MNHQEWFRELDQPIHLNSKNYFILWRNETFRNRMTYGWLNEDLIFISGLTIPLGYPKVKV